MPPQPDPRRIVGGTCWAKSTSVSNDSRRVYGAEAGNLWLCGTVLEVLSIRSEGAQRATTWIKAKYTVGNTEKVKLLNLMQLKRENPVAVPDAPAPEVAPPVAPAVAAAPGNDNGGSSPPTAETITAAAVPGTEASEETANSSGSSVRTPVVTVHDR